MEMFKEWKEARNIFEEAKKEYDKVERSVREEYYKELRKIIYEYISASCEQKDNIYYIINKVNNQKIKNIVKEYEAKNMIPFVFRFTGKGTIAIFKEIGIRYMYGNEVDGWTDVYVDKEDRVVDIDLAEWSIGNVVMDMGGE